MKTHEDKPDPKKPKIPIWLILLLIPAVISIWVVRLLPLGRTIDMAKEVVYIYKSHRARSKLAEIGRAMAAYAKEYDEHLPVEAMLHPPNMPDFNTVILREQERIGPNDSDEIFFMPPDDNSPPFQNKK